MATAQQLNDPMDWKERNTIDGIWKILRIAGWAGACIALLLPLIAMSFTNEVNWTVSDFIFAAIILGSIGAAFEFGIRRSGDGAYRTGVVVALVTMLLLLWSNAAVGFVGSGANTANVLYFLLVFVPIVGGIAGRFAPKGMVRTMTVTAILQGLIAVFAFAAGYVSADERTALLVINGVFIAMWIGSALLFSQAARRRNGDAMVSDTRTGASSIHFLLSVLLIAVGAMLAVFMISTESEPGAIPLLFVLIGMGWFFITLFRTRSGAAR